MTLTRKSPLARSPMPRGPRLTGVLGQASFQKVRMKRCAICKAPFEPRSMTHKACSTPCAVALAERDRIKNAAKLARADRAETKRALAKFKSIPKLKAEAQVIFNKAMRRRDELAGHACICCGRFPSGVESLTGGAWDAAHYRSRGSADHVRFNENNVHRSLKVCNTWGHTDYRGGLIKRIGLEAVEALECEQTVIKWTREMLEGIKATYTKKLKEMGK